MEAEAVLTNLKIFNRKRFNMANINEERVKKFRDMGIPMPMAPVDPSTAQGPVKNVEFAKKLAAIKGGAIKETVDVFLEKEKVQTGFVPLEVPKKGNLQEKAQPKNITKPQTSGPSFDLYEKALYGESSSVSESHSVSPRTYASDMNNESNGSEFISDIRTRLAEKFNRPAPNQVNGQIVLNENSNKSPNIKPGQIVIDEAQLKETITTISTQLIKKFMTEFLSSEPSLIKENDKIKKAEIVQEGVVKIDGKFFKLTPVTLKKK